MIAVVCAAAVSWLVAARPADAAPAEGPVVATHYFYWYRWPDKHFNLPGAPGREGHFHHLPRPEEVSYLNPDWHAREFAAMNRAGVDVALPVYWGAPGAYERETIRFSRDGLAPMVQALRKLGDRGVKLGLFYDTSTLANATRGASPPEGRPDLTQPEGQDLFCQTIIEYFEHIPQDLWARIDGRPLVVLYAAAFAEKWDATLADVLRRRFESRFPGEQVFLVADASWGEIGQDRTTRWGAALAGPQLFPGVAQIGAGYNDTPVPERTTPIRHREDGNFYRHSWRAALRHQPQLVLLETWNEMHEGTDICQTIETGATYLDLTREYVTKLKHGGDPGREITLQWPDPQPQSTPAAP
jgi:hypothetical protein